MNAPVNTVEQSAEATEAATVVLRHERSGRSVLLDLSGERGQIEIRTAGGELELSIRLTESGPVLSVSAARIELKAVEAVAVHCRRFEVEATEAARIESAGGIELKATADLRLDGERLYLNCDRDFSG